MNVLSLFSGIGGLDLGLQRAGMTIAGQVEIDPWCRKILAKHWPEVPRHDDVHTAADWWGSWPAPDVVAGGFPCQPVSIAGTKKAQSDERWLWPAMAAVIVRLRPTWVIAENVPGLYWRGLTDVLRDLARAGYRTRTGILPACAMGAPHPRSRVFIMAHAQGIGCDWSQQREREATAEEPESARCGTPAGGGWAAEPRLGRVAYGVPAQVDRLRGLGNAVVPQVAEHIGRLILAGGAA